MVQCKQLYDVCCLGIHTLEYPLVPTFSKDLPANIALEFGLICTSWRMGIKKTRNASALLILVYLTHLKSSWN